MESRDNRDWSEILMETEEKVGKQKKWWWVRGTDIDRSSWGPRGYSGGADIRIETEEREVKYV